MLLFIKCVFKSLLHGCKCVTLFTFRCCVQREGNVLACVRISSSPFLLSRLLQKELDWLPASWLASLLAINNNPCRADSFFFRLSRVNVSAYIHEETFVLRSFSRSVPPYSMSAANFDSKWEIWRLLRSSRGSRLVEQNADRKFCRLTDQSTQEWLPPSAPNKMPCSVSRLSR